MELKEDFFFKNHPAKILSLERLGLSRFSLCRHTASPPITSGMHTGGVTQCSRREARKRPAESNGTPAMDIGLWRHTHTQTYKHKRSRTKHTSINTQHSIVCLFLNGDKFRLFFFCTHTATRCKTLQHTATHWYTLKKRRGERKCRNKWSAFYFFPFFFHFFQCLAVSTSTSDWPTLTTHQQTSLNLGDPQSTLPKKLHRIWWNSRPRPGAGTFQAARPYESCKILKGRPRRNAFSKLVHRQYKSFPSDRFCQIEIKKTTGLSNKHRTA